MRARHQGALQSKEWAAWEQSNRYNQVMRRGKVRLENLSAPHQSPLRGYPLWALPHMRLASAAPVVSIQGADAPVGRAVRSVISTMRSAGARRKAGSQLTEICQRQDQRGYPIIAVPRLFSLPRMVARRHSRFHPFHHLPILLQACIHLLLPTTQLPGHTRLGFTLLLGLIHLLGPTLLPDVFGHLKRKIPYHQTICHCWPNQACTGQHTG